MNLIQFIKRQAILFSAFVVILLILINTGIVYYNKLVLKKASELQKETEKVKLWNEQIWNQVVRNVDIGMRGYALTKDSALLNPYTGALTSNVTIMKDLRETTKKQGFQRLDVFDSIDVGVSNYIKTCTEMINLVKKDSMAQFTAMMKQDAGADLWPIYSKNSKIIEEFETSLNNKAVLDNEKANFRTMLIQIILVIIGIPTLMFMVYEIRKDRKARKKLFLDLEKNNRQYLFDPGTPINLQNENEVISNSIKNFKKATEFISQISSGNFSVDWEELNDQNKAANKTNLAGELVQMKEKMKLIKEEDKIRNWTSEGLTRFSEVIRNHQHDMQALSNEVVLFITKYMHAQQGGLFVVREGIEDQPYLELLGCYAFDRKKHLNKRVEVGEGLVGQIYLEKQAEMYMDIPDGYLSITSGLGEKTPHCVLIVPMIYNEKVEAVIELAGFVKYEKYEIEFMEKVGEIMASTLGAVKNTEKVQLLLDQFRVQTEQLRAQEEELRQNMEEMEATQEALRRQDKEDQVQKNGDQE